ncbi:hypothetical protein [Intestinibacter sp.]
MKKLILTMIYTFPVVVLVFALGQNLTSTTTTFLNEENIKKSTIERESDNYPKTPIEDKTNYNDNKQNETDNDHSSNVSTNKKNSAKIKIPKESNTCINVLLICTDNNLKNPRNKFSVCSIDSGNNRIKLIPIPESTYINVDKMRHCKLSDTYAWGNNTDLVLHSINSKFEANITKVVEVNTESVSEISKKLKDMDIDMSEDKILEYLNETKITKAMIEDFKSIPVFKYPKLISCMRPYFKTNIDTASLIKYGIITYRILGNK